MLSYGRPRGREQLRSTWARTSGSFPSSWREAWDPRDRFSVLSQHRTQEERFNVSLIATDWTSIVDVRGDAVAATNGVQTFYATPATTSVANSLIPPTGHWHALTVKTVSIDSATAPVADVSCLKIDAEGAELDVLRGARETILRSRPAIALDVHPASLRSAGLQTADVYDFVRDIGYQIPRDSPLTSKNDGGPFDVLLVPE